MKTFEEYKFTIRHTSISSNGNCAKTWVSLVPNEDWIYVRYMASAYAAFLFTGFEDRGNRIIIRGGTGDMSYYQFNCDKNSSYGKIERLESYCDFDVMIKMTNVTKIIFYANDTNEIDKEILEKISNYNINVKIEKCS